MLNSYKELTVWQKSVDLVKIAFGSGAELETQIIIAKRLGFTSGLKVDGVENLLSEVMKMLNKLVATLNPSR